MAENKFKLINNGVCLNFSNAFINHFTFREKLKRYLVDLKLLESTRAEVLKDVGMVKVYYQDNQAKSKLKGKLLQSVSHKFIKRNQQGKMTDKNSQAVELNINLENELVSVADNYFPYSSEYIRNYDGLTELLYKEFFQIEPIKNITESVKFYNEIRSIIAIGNAGYQYEIESIVAEYQDPFRKGSEVK